ncbi:MAG: hypothetical protein K5746_01385, partial [Clostridiales bacterium]|nr:hypothetical protein [Clostridiales bacterium]
MPRDFFAQGRGARALLCLLLAAAAAACVLLGRGGEASGLIDPEQLEESAFSVPAPAFSVPSGFYAEPLTLFLSVPEGTAVYYTLDCSD